MRRATLLTLLGVATALVGIPLLDDPAQGAPVVALGLLSAAVAGEWSLRRGRGHRRRDDTDHSGVLRAEAFDRTLRERVTLASRQLRPLTLVLLELHEQEWTPPSAFAAEVGLLRGRLLRTSDVVARFGDRRLALVLDEADEIAAKDAVDRLRAALDESHDHEHPHTLVAGVASYPRHALDVDRLLDRATQALDEARAIGRSVTLAPVDAPD